MCRKLVVDNCSQGKDGSQALVLEEPPRKSFVHSLLQPQKHSACFPRDYVYVLDSLERRRMRQKEVWMTLVEGK